MEHSPPNCNYETFTIHTSSLGASSNVNFTSTFTRPIKDVVEASIIAASIRKADTTVSNVAYVRITELESNFVDFAAAGQPAVSSGADNSHNFPTGSNFLRRCFGAIYNSDDATSNRLSYKDRYPMTTQYIYPIERLNELTINFYDNSGTELVNPTIDGITYLTFRFICKRKNLC
tara:strand:- start:94 stop:618 length:525 start_codon:yes stop_codon:yes gene_type:complete